MSHPGISALGGVARPGALAGSAEAIAAPRNPSPLALAMISTMVMTPKTCRVPWMRSVNATAK